MSKPGQSVVTAAAILFAAACDKQVSEQRGSADSNNSAAPIPVMQEAAAHFTFRGAQLHPTCVDFSQEGSSRGMPMDLAKCSGSVLTATTDNRGWSGVEFVPPQRGSVSYLVLAQKGDRFLIAIESWGGGTGQFSSLTWVRLDDVHVTNVADVTGGDRCAGGVSSFSTIEKGVQYHQNLTPAAFVALSGEQVDSATTAKLGWEYGDCFASAVYHYNLQTESAELSGAQLAVDAPAAGAPTDTLLRRNDPHSCINKIALQYAIAGKSSLTVAQLGEFVREFRSKCG